MWDTYIHHPVHLDFHNKDHNGNKYLLLSCAILGIILYVTSYDRYLL